MAESSPGQKYRQLSRTSSPSQAPKPAWGSTTVETVKRAKGYGKQLEALSIQAMNMQLDPENWSSLQSQIKGRMAIRDVYIRGLNSKCRNVELVMFELRENIAMLKRAIWSKWAPLCVVRERIRIRSTKPLEEQHHDAWQIALESEEATLAQSRQELLELVRQSQDWMSKLTQARQDMLDDLNSKRRVGKCDHTVLLEGHGKGIPFAEACNFLPLEETLPKMLRLDHRSHEKTDEETELARVRNKVAEVEHYINSVRSQMKENCDVSQEKGRLCLAASMASLTNMNLHIAALQAYIKQLRELISECEKHIIRGELAVDVAGFRLSQSADPIRRISRQYQARMNHPDQVNLPRDRVDVKLEKTLDAVKTFICSITSHIVLTTDVMVQLKKTKRLLEQAMDIKQKAFQTDSLCVKEKREWIKTSSLPSARDSQTGPCVPDHPTDESAPIS